MSELLIMIEGKPIGRVRGDKAGRLSLVYESSWLESPQGHSLSVSMPLAQITYPHKAVLSYLWNLLPENPNVLQRWAQQYHVSAANPFKLLANAGADVPGAAQFIPPERLEEIRSAKTRLRRCAQVIAACIGTALPRPGPAEPPRSRWAGTICARKR